MKSPAVALSTLSALFVVLILGLVVAKPVLAQVGGTSTGSSSTSSISNDIASSTTTIDQSTDTLSPTTTSTQVDQAVPTDTPIAPAPTEAAPAQAAPPAGLTEVHIIGTMYTDYFTDGTTMTSYPGDPDIDGNFDKPGAPIPTHEGLTWVHTTGQYLYDTPSGDLEQGDYSVQPNGAYITNTPSNQSATTSAATPNKSASSSASQDTNVPSSDFFSSTTASVAVDLPTPDQGQLGSSTPAQNQ